MDKMFCEVGAEVITSQCPDKKDEVFAKWCGFNVIDLGGPTTEVSMTVDDWRHICVSSGRFAKDGEVFHDLFHQATGEDPHPGGDNSRLHESILGLIMNEAKLGRKGFAATYARIHRYNFYASASGWPTVSIRPAHEGIVVGMVGPYGRVDVLVKPREDLTPTIESWDTEKQAPEKECLQQH